MRTEDQINQDYTKLCTQAGDIQYRLKRMTEELDRVHVQLRALEQEFSQMTRVPTEELENPQETIAP